MRFKEDLKSSPFISIHSKLTAARVPPMDRFAPNFAQTLIRPWHTIWKSVVVIGMYLVKIQKTVCFEHNVQEFVVLYFGPLLVYQDSFDNFLSGGSTHASRKVWCKSLKLPRRSSKK